MNYQTRTIVHFQLTSGDMDSDSNSLEIEDKELGAIMDIRCSASDEHELVIYGSAESLSVPIQVLEKAIEIARREVRNFPIQQAGQPLGCNTQRRWRRRRCCEESWWHEDGTNDENWIRLRHL